MKNKNELLDKQNKNVTFEEMEKVEAVSYTHLTLPTN